MEDEKDLMEKIKNDIITLLCQEFRKAFDTQLKYAVLCSNGSDTIENISIRALGDVCYEEFKSKVKDIDYSDWVVFGGKNIKEVGSQFYLIEPTEEDDGY